MFGNEAPLPICVSLGANLENMSCNTLSDNCYPSVHQLLKTLPVLQAQLDALLEFDVSDLPHVYVCYKCFAQSGTDTAALCLFLLPPPIYSSLLESILQ